MKLLMKIKSLSVFFPAYNEEGNIKKTVKSACKFLQAQDFPWEIIIVDDGSTDKTGAIAEKLAYEDKRIQVIHQTNGGYGMALRTGFERAKYEWVVYLDADGQFDFSEINKFLPLTDSCDAIWGCRVNRKDNFLRLVTGKLWLISLRLLFGLKIRDVNCGFKMIKKFVIDRIGPFSSTRGGMINAELAIKILRGGYCLCEVEVSHFPRQKGTASGVSLPVIFRSYWELLMMRWRL